MFQAPPWDGSAEFPPVVGAPPGTAAQVGSIRVSCQDASGPHPGRPPRGAPFVFSFFFEAGSICNISIAGLLFSLTEVSSKGSH